MIYLFDIKERLIKAIPKTATYVLEQKQIISKEKYVSDRLYAEVKSLPAHIIKRAQYIAIQSVDDPYKYHLFFISNLIDRDNITKIEGVQSGIEELRKTIVEDKRPESKTSMEVVSQLLEGTNWQGKFLSQDNLRLSSNYYYISVFDALKKVCEIYDLEMQFFAEIDGNKVGARVITFSKKVGTRSAQRVVYGRNALSIIHEEDRVSLYTALIGRGRALEVSSKEENASGHAGYGRKITFEDIEWQKARGNPVNKSAGQKYVEISGLTEAYGIRKPDGSMHPKIGVIEFDEEDSARLLERTYEALEEMARPKIQYSVEVTHIKEPGIGNTVRVVRHDKGVDYETRIIELVLDRITNKAIEIKIGDHFESVADSLSKSVSKVSDEVAQGFQAYEAYVQDYMESHRETSYYTVDDPKEAYPGKVKIGDLWYKADPEHEREKILLRWTGEVWEEVFRTYGDNQVQDAIKEAEKSAEAKIAEIKSEINSENEAKLNDFKSNLVGFKENLLKGSRDFSGRWNISEEKLQGMLKRSFEYEGVKILSHTNSTFKVGQRYDLEEGKIYNFSFYGKIVDEVGSIGIYFRDIQTPEMAKLLIYDTDVVKGVGGIRCTWGNATNQIRRFSVSFKCIKSGFILPYVEVGLTSGKVKTIWFGGFKLEIGDIPTPWTPHKDDVIDDFKTIKSDFNQSMDSIRTSVTSLSSDTLRKSELSISDEGITLASGKTVDGNALASMIGVSPEGVNIISSKVRIGGVNITDGAVDASKIKAESISATHLQSEAITANAIKVDQAMADKLLTGDLLANALMANTAMINHLKALDIVGDNIKGGKISGVDIEVLGGGLTVYSDKNKSQKVVYFDPLTKRYVFSGTIDATYGKVGGFNLWQNQYAKIFTPDDLNTAICGMSDGTNWLLYAGKNPNGTWDKTDLDSAKFRLTRDGACYLRKAFLQTGSFVGNFSIFEGALRLDIGDTTTFVSGNHDHVFGVYNKGYYAHWNSAKACISRNGQIKCSSLSQTSDRRLKAGILCVDKEEAYRTIRDSRIVEYHLKDDETKRKHIGFIAQEFDELDSAYQGAILESHEGYYGASYIDYNNLSVAAMQHLIDRVEKLEREVEECKKKCTYKSTLWGSLLELVKNVKTKMMSTMGLWRRTRS